MTPGHRLAETPRATLRAWTWILVIAGSSLGFSLAFACATPFIALAAVAGLRMRPSDAMLAVGLAWLGNQAIGFLVLHYPHTGSTFAWGAAIGVAALLAVVGAAPAASVSSRPLVRVAVAFAIAFAAYEGALFAASLVLPSEGNAFALWIVARILEINAVAYAGLLVLHRLAVGTGLVPATGGARPVAV